MEQGQDWKADVDACLQRGDTAAAVEAMGEVLKKEAQWDRELAFAHRLIGIYEEEQRAGETPTVLDGVENVDESISHFVWVKLLLRRLEFGLPEEYQQEMYRYCKERQVSAVMLSSILKVNIIHKEETCKRMIVLYERNEGKQSDRMHYFQKLLQELDGVG